MSNSLLSSEHACYVCGTMQDLHRHHVFEGNGRRAQSERYGCWVYLCGRHHNMSNAGVHFNKELDLRIKRECQSRWEKKHGTREEFIRTFTRSYL